MPETLPVTGTVTAHRFVKLNSNGTSVSTAGAGETVYGVALDSANVNIAPATTPVEREAATVDAVGTLAVNDLVESDASGKAVALADGEAAGRVVSVTGTQVRVDLTARSAGTSGSGPLGPLIHLSRPVAAVAAGDDGFADWTGATVDAPLVVNDYNLELPADQVWSIQVQAYPDASEATGQFLATIAWNADGQELYGTRASLDSDTFFDFSTASLLRATGDDLSNRTVTFKVWNLGAVAHDFSLDVYLQRLA